MFLMSCLIIRIFKRLHIKDEREGAKMINITNAINQFKILDRLIKLGKERYIYIYSINLYFHFIAIYISNIVLNCEIIFSC